MTIDLKVDAEREDTMTIDDINEAIFDEKAPSARRSNDNFNKKKSKLDENSLLNLSIHDSDDELTNQNNNIIENNVQIECTSLTQEKDDKNTVISIYSFF